MRIPLLFLLVLLLFGAVSQMAAQTTYTSTKPFTCDTAVPSGYQITSSSQFSCRGIFYYSPAGAFEAEFFFQGAYDHQLFDAYPVLYAQNWGPISAVTSFSLPICSGIPLKCSSPGTLSFTLSFTDQNGLLHTGTFSASWQDETVCGGRGCRWVSPELMSSTLTVN